MRPNGRDALGVRYLRADITAARPGRRDVFDVAVCSFGLSDIDDLDAALLSVHDSLAPGGRFVFSIVHPCFPGGRTVAGSWPTGGGYADEGRWAADAAASTLRRQVGTNHRTLSTYINSLHRAGLRLETISEPPPWPQWTDAHPDAASFPVFLVGACTRP